jgi:ubiquinone/menaquinone biosynthesis C-methylase UbiE
MLKGADGLKGTTCKRMAKPVIHDQGGDSVKWDWELVYETGDFRKHWDYRVPSQELVTFLACNLLPRGEKVLDVGCGAGREAIFLAQCGFCAIGVDWSAAALRIADERAREAGVFVEWIQGNVLDLPLEKESVVFVNDRGLFHLLSDEQRPQYAEQIARVLKPGGYVLLRGAREAEGWYQGFNPVTEEAIDRFFGRDFERGPVLPFEMASDVGVGFRANVVVLRKK